MKNCFCLLTLFAGLVLIFALPASAQILYENGPINGTTDAWTINEGFAVSDTFTISGGTSTVTGMAFGAWLFPGDVLESVDVSFTQFDSGNEYFEQVLNLTASNCSGNQYGFNVCTETGAFSNGPTLPNGTYWINLSNAVVNDGDPVYWDENSGIGCHSQGCPSQPSLNSEGTIAAEAFSILGQTSSSTAPEPGSILLFASGVVGVAGLLRRKVL